MKDGKFRQTEIAAAVFCVVLVVSALWGEANQGSSLPFAKKIPGRKIAIAGRLEPSDTQGFSLEDETTGKTPELNQEQIQVLDEIAASLKNKEMEKAARIIAEKQALLSDLFYGIMKGERYLYSQGDLKKEIEGEGLVVTMANTVFYGSFQAGAPDGVCIVLQTVKLDAPRYDYSYGLWKQGKMEGEGYTGYCYYEEGPTEEARDVRKSGIFADNLMEGNLEYQSISQKGEISHWELEARKGVTVLDENWTYLEEGAEYQLMSVDDDSHAYLLEEEQASEPIWKNLLVWGDDWE